MHLCGVLGDKLFCVEPFVVRVDASVVAQNEVTQVYITETLRALVILEESHATAVVHEGQVRVVLSVCFARVVGKVDFLALVEALDALLGVLL